MNGCVLFWTMNQEVIVAVDVDVVDVVDDAVVAAV